MHVICNYQVSSIKKHNSIEFGILKEMILILLILDSQREQY